MSLSQLPSAAPTTVVAGPIPGGATRDSDIALVIGGSVAAGLFGLWCIFSLIKWTIYRSQSQEKKRILREIYLGVIEQKNVREGILSSSISSQNENPYQHVNEFSVDIESPRIGAFADGIPVFLNDTHGKISVGELPSRAVENMTGVMVKQPPSSIVNSDVKSSIVVSSLSSSEIRDTFLHEASQPVDLRSAAPQASDKSSDEQSCSESSTSSSSRKVDPAGIDYDSSVYSLPSALTDIL